MSHTQSHVKAAAPISGRVCLSPTLPGFDCGAHEPAMVNIPCFPTEWGELIQQLRNFLALSFSLLNHRALNISRTSPGVKPNPR